MDAPDQPQPQAGPADSDDPFGPPSIQVPAVIPPVVVVVVAHNPGDWFPETLASLANQTYPNTSVLVIDAGSDVELQPVIAAAAPDAHVRRIEENPGFGPAANQVLTAVEGASFYLFCHDDVRLEPDVVQVMVEEAFRSNAGMVGAKVVEWNDPNRILQVGMGADKTGAPAPLVERGELDQEQHDAVRDVFYIPGAATLVRGDLFTALGGFDPGIELLGEDLDLSWRAHVVGARVLVAPGARIAHLEALGQRRPVDDRRRLQMRHRLRTSRVSYTRWSRLRVMPQAALLAVGEFLFGVVTGRFHHAADVVAAWTWNTRHRSSIRQRRRLLAEHRRVSDRDVRRLQIRGSARMAAFLRGQLGLDESRLGDNRLGTMTGAGRDLVTNLRSARARSSLVAWLAVLALLAFGSRELLTGGIPVVGQFVNYPGHPSTLVQQWLSGFRGTGLGSEQAAPTLLGVLGGLGYLFLGAMGLLRTVLVVAALPLGALGIWRLARPLGSRRARITALVVYVCLPVGINAMARGRWDGLVIYGLVPWMANQLVKGSQLAPFGPVGGDVGPGVADRPVWQRILLLGVVTALAAMVEPVAVVIVVALGVCFALGGLLSGQVRGALRLIGVALAGAAVAALLQLPWSAALATGGWRAFVGLSSTGGPALSLGAILRFQTGPFGSAPLGWVFLPAGLLVLVIGRRWRLGWGVRCWVVVMASAGLVFTSQAVPPGWFPAPEVLLAPGAMALALATGLGMAAFEIDLPDYHFGWRQIASVVAGAALILGVFPLVGASMTGQWGLPTSDFSSTLSNLGAKDGDSGPYRVLWLGDASLVPGAPWRLATPGIDQLGTGQVLSYATSTGGSADVSDLLPGPDSGATQQLTQTLRIAGAGDTTRLGALLAPMGVRYVVVPLADAPKPFNTGPTSQPTAVLSMLNAQLDLADVDVIEGVAVFRNASWGPTRAQLPAHTALARPTSSLASRVAPGLAGAPTALPHTSSYQSFSGSVNKAQTVYLSEAGSSHWSLHVDGRQVSRTDALGWANAFEVPAPAPGTPAGGSSATLTFDTPATRWLELLGQALLWLVALGYLFRNRVRAQSDRDRAVMAAEGELA